METLKNIFSWLSDKPKWVKSLAVVVVALICAMLFFSSCSSTRATVRNPRNSATTSITISVSNPQTVDVSPSVDSTQFGINLTPKSN